MEIIKRFGKPVDIIFREENEIEWLLKDRSAIDFEIMDKGKVVYGEDIISKYKKLFSMVIRKYNLTKKPELGKGVWEYTEREFTIK